MGRVKNQHYVPQSYLQRFCSAEGKIFVFDKVKFSDKPEKSVFPSAVRNIASENGFYDLPPDFSADAQAVEKTFGKVEGDAQGAINSLLEEVERDCGFDPRQEERRAILGTFIALQDIRTLAFRQTYTQIQDSLLAKITQMHEVARKHYESKGEKVEVQPVNLGIPVDRLPVVHAKTMFSPEYILQAVGALNSHIWLVGRNDTTQPLYTSDAPVFRHPHVQHPLLGGGAGLTSLGVEIFLPLTPRYVLILCERTYFLPRLRVKEGGIISLDANGVRFYNGMQIVGSRRQIYCSEDKFGLVREAANENPELFNPDRQRFQVMNGAD